jgi:hypothetical protein
VRSGEEALQTRRLTHQYLSIFLSIFLSICLICIRMYPSIYLSIYVPVYLYLSIYLCIAAVRELLGVRGGRGRSPAHREMSIFFCRTTSASTAPCTSRRMCCLTHYASYCALCQPLLQALPPPTFGRASAAFLELLGVRSGREALSTRER